MEMVGSREVDRKTLAINFLSSNPKQDGDTKFSGQKKKKLIPFSERKKKEYLLLLIK